MTLRYTILGMLCLLLFVVGCQAQIIDQPTPAPGTTGTFSFEDKEGIQTFASQDEYDAFVLQNQPSNTFGFGGIAEMAVRSEAVSLDVAQDSGATSFSKTNVQELGIDEADIVKTDGDLVFVISGKTLYVIENKDVPQIINEIVLTHSPQSMFVDQETVMIMSRVSDYEDYPDVPLSTQLTALGFYKKSDLSLDKEIVVEGNYMEARLSDGALYLITSTQPQVGVTPLFFDGGMARMPVERILWFPQPYDSVVLTSVYKIDTDSVEIEDSKAITTSWGQQVYMSQDLIVVGWSESVNEWQIGQDVLRQEVMPLLRSEDKELIERIQSVEDDILSPSEKEQKILQIIMLHLERMGAKDQNDLEKRIEKQVNEILDQYEYRTFTNMVGMDTNDLDVVGEQQIAGTTYDQFAFSEYEGVLRVVTTTDRIWRNGKEDKPSENHIYTLDAELNILDHEDGIAIDERIFSARYVGDMLYMVTFRQVDPFFVVDLSDPKNIDVLGELKIPGFSRYLHPISDDIILGFGRDATDEGRQQGVKLSLFDVSDPTDPREVATHTLDQKYGSSAAEWEHKAFLYDANSGSLVVPYYSYDWRAEEGVNGALVFDIGDESIELRGLVAHGDARNAWQTQVQRSLFIDNNLYTISNTLVRVNAFDTLESITDISLSGKQDFGDVVVY